MPSHGVAISNFVCYVQVLSNINRIETGKISKEELERDEANFE